MAEKRSRRPPAKAAVERYRSRMKGRGMVRVEVQVTKDDATLVRAVAAALTNPARQAEARAFLREQFGSKPTGFKAFLAAAPLDGIRVKRRRDGRRVAL